MILGILTSQVNFIQFNELIIRVSIINYFSITSYD